MPAAAGTPLKNLVVSSVGVGVPLRTGLEGRWRRDSLPTPTGGATSSVPAGSASCGPAPVAQLLQLPPLACLARQQTRELVVSETDSQLQLNYITRLNNGCSLTSSELYCKAGQLRGQVGWRGWSDVMYRSTRMRS